MLSRGTGRHRQRRVSPGILSGLAILGIAFVLRGANGSSSTSSYSSEPSANEVAFPNCTGFQSFIRDGYCDDSNNNVVCINVNIIMNYSIIT